jgi:hypothetical protein
MAKILPTDTPTFEQLIRKTGNDIPAALLPPNVTEEIDPYWQEAAEDLLSPAPEAVARLFENITTLYMDEAV